MKRQRNPILRQAPKQLLSFASLSVSLLLMLWKLVVYINGAVFIGDVAIRLLSITWQKQGLCWAARANLSLEETEVQINTKKRLRDLKDL